MPLPHLFLFHGENQIAAKAELTKWQQAFREKHGEFNLESLDPAPKGSQILSITQTMPFLGEKRLVTVHDYFDTSKPEDQEQLVSQLQTIPESSVTIFFESSSIDKRRKSSKELLKIANERHFPSTQKHDLPSVIQQEAKRHSKQIDYHLANELAHQFSANPDRINQEIAKLASFCPTNQETITKEDIQQICSLPFPDSVFDLTDALGASNRQRPIAILHHLFNSGEDLMRLYYLLTNQIRLLLIAKLTNCDFSKVKPLKIHPFVQKKLSQASRNYSTPQLIRALKHLTIIDHQIKSGQLRYTKNNNAEFLFALERFLATS